MVKHDHEEEYMVIEIEYIFDKNEIHVSLRNWYKDSPLNFGLFLRKCSTELIKKMMGKFMYMR